MVIAILPYVLSTSLKSDAVYSERCQCRHVDAEAKPSKRSTKEGTHGAVTILKFNEVQIVRVSQGSDPKKSFLRKDRELRLNASAGHAEKIFSRHLVPNWIYGNEKGHLEELSKKVSLMSEILARLDMRKIPEETSR